MKLMCCGDSNGSMDMDTKNSKKEDEAAGERKCKGFRFDNHQRRLDNPNKSGLK